jgi:hypothetical protein
MLSTWIALASIAPGFAAPHVDIGRPLPGSHETVFVSPVFWDPTDPLNPSYELAAILDDVIEQAKTPVDDAARHSLSARLAREIEAEALDALHRDPALRYSGLYVYLQGGGRMSTATSAWYDIDFAEHGSHADDKESDAEVRARAYATTFLADFCARFPMHPTCRRRLSDG